MKHQEKIEKESDIQRLRTIRDRIGVEIQNLNYEELKKYVESRLTLHPGRKWK